MMLAQSVMEIAIPPAPTARSAKTQEANVEFALDGGNNKPPKEQEATIDDKTVTSDTAPSPGHNPSPNKPISISISPPAPKTGNIAWYSNLLPENTPAENNEQAEPLAPVAAPEALLARTLIPIAKAMDKLDIPQAPPPLSEGQALLPDPEFFRQNLASPASSATSSAALSQLATSAGIVAPEAAGEPHTAIQSQQIERKIAIMPVPKKAQFSLDVPEPESTDAAPTAKTAKPDFSASIRAVTFNPANPANPVSLVSSTGPAKDVETTMPDTELTNSRETGKSQHLAMPDLEPLSRPASPILPSGLRGRLASPPDVATQVRSHIIERFDGDAQRFEIKLNPPELGKVDIRIEIGPDKKMQILLATREPMALAELMRGARALETSLQDIGMDMAADGITFRLDRGGQRDPTPDQDGSQNKGGGMEQANKDTQTEHEPETLDAIPHLTSFRRLRYNISA